MVEETGIDELADNELREIDNFPDLIITNIPI